MRRRSGDTQAFALAFIMDIEPCTSEAAEPKGTVSLDMAGAVGRELGFGGGECEFGKGIWLNSQACRRCREFGSAYGTEKKN